jgi:hypothetical protein
MSLETAITICRRLTALYRKSTLLRGSAEEAAMKLFDIVALRWKNDEDDRRTTVLRTAR